MPTISNLRDRCKYKILRKAVFADDYVEDTSLRIEYGVPNVYGAAAPEIETFTLRRPIGTVKEHDDTDFVVGKYNYVDYSDHHFKIRSSVDDGATWETLFVGYCEEQTLVMERADFPQGTQKFTLFGYAARLDKQPIRTGRVYNPATATTHDLEWTPAFNAKNHKRRIDMNLSGNRSTETEDAIYVFSEEDGHIWTNLNIAEYLIKIGLPQCDFFNELPLEGQHIALDKIMKYWPAPEKPESLWKWLVKVIDRRYAFGFYLKYTDGATEAEEGSLAVQVFTVTDVDITVGPITIPANATQTTFSLDFSYPDNHEWENLEFRKSKAEKYDRIEVRGERILMTGTFRADINGSWGEPMMVKQWIDAIETNYRAGSNTNDAELNDLARSTDVFDSVFSQVAPPPAWTYKMSENAFTEHFFGLSSDDDGVVDNTDEAAPWYAGFHTFERTIPLHSGKDYWTSPIFSYAVSEPPEFRPMFAFVKLIGGPMSGNYAPVDRLSEVDEEYRSIQFRPLDNIPMGVGLGVSPRHYVAQSFEWSDAKPSNTDPSGDITWPNIFYTASWRLDTRQRVAEDLTEEGEEEASSSSTTPCKTLVIDVKDAEYWYVMPGTIIEISDIGTPRYIHADNAVLRDDVAKLQGVLAAAKAWYSKHRQAMEFNLKSPKKHVDIGTMITDVTGVDFGSESVRSVVTKRTISVSREGASVRIETGWNNFDFAGAWDDA
jgi:hypothetical protein